MVALQAFLSCLVFRWWRIWSWRCWLPTSPWIMIIRSTCILKQRVQRILIPLRKTPENTQIIVIHSTGESDTVSEFYSFTVSCPVKSISLTFYISFCLFCIYSREQLDLFSANRSSQKRKFETISLSHGPGLVRV